MHAGLLPPLAGYTAAGKAVGDWLQMVITSFCLCLIIVHAGVCVGGLPKPFRPALIQGCDGAHHRTRRGHLDHEPSDSCVRAQPGRQSSGSSDVAAACIDTGGEKIMRRERSKAELPLCNLRGDRV